MRTFLLGDIHFGLHHNELDKWLDIHYTYFNDFFFPMLISESFDKTVDKIFLLGDIFDNRSFLDLKVINKVLDLFTRFEELDYQVVIIGGNHDYYNNYDSDNTSLRILEKFKNVEIFTKPHIYNLLNKKVLLLPWDKHESQLSEIKKWSGKVDYLFTHSDLRGAKTGIKNVLHSGNTIADYVGIPKVYASHIHLVQKIDNFRFIGSPFHMDRNDKNDKKGVFILDIEKETEKFIPNNISPEFKTIEILDINDFEKISESNIEAEKKNFIDIVINNSLLAEPKNIKTLSTLTKANLVSKVYYIDDTIALTDGIKNIDLDDIGINITTEDLIFEYIKNQDIEENKKDIYLDIIKNSIKLCNQTIED